MQDVHFDFAVLLTLLALFTGLGYLLDVLWLAPRRRDRIGDDKPGMVVDFCRSFFPVIAAVLVLRSFVAEPFRIPSGSMIPTLLVGDFILVNKFAYGVRDPVFHHEFLPVGRPQRGDVVVFRWPRDPSTDFIKRIVGVPGDRIVYRDKVLTINGEVAALTPEGAYAAGRAPAGLAYRLREDLGAVSHQILVNPDLPAENFEFTVPEGEYFAMGDNRDGSFDSRGWGTVAERHLVGKAFLIWMSWDGQAKRPYLSRIGTRIR
ncbi:MAG TPA: signal peptidase I [Nevskiaceae bacterium]|nr:signal peptidase I [Nevskiaceae bacterium]